MDLGSGELISRAKVDKVKMTKMVIDRVEQLAAAQGYKSLKFFNRKKKEMLLSNIDLLMGVDSVSNEIIDGEELDLPSITPPGGLLSGPDEDLEVDDEIDPEEIVDLVNDAAQNNVIPSASEEEVNPGVNDNDAIESDGKDFELCDEMPEEVVEDEIPDLESETHEDVHEETQSVSEPGVSNERPSRAARAPERYNPATGQSYAQQEIYHNIVAQTINDDNTLKYSGHETAFVAHALIHLRKKCFAQQFNLRRGLREFNEEGKHAAKVELKQMHDRICW